MPDIDAPAFQFNEKWSLNIFFTAKHWRIRIIAPMLLRRSESPSRVAINPTSPAPSVAPEAKVSMRLPLKRMIATMNTPESSFRFELSLFSAFLLVRNHTG